MTKVCILVIYGDTQAVLVADQPISEDEWRNRINATAKRYDELEDEGAEPKDGAERTAELEGLAALLCYRHPDIKRHDYVEVAPQVIGSSW